VGISTSIRKGQFMNKLQEILLFPVRDAQSQKEFLIACAIMLAGFIIPIIPMLILLGYCARIMRQIIQQREEPSMPAWQGSDWSEMLVDGLRLWGAQVILMLPLFLLVGCAIVFILGGTVGFSAFSEQNTNSFAPIGMLLFMIGFSFFGLFAVLSLPYGVLVSAALPHIAIKRSFQAAFEFQEWFTIFRKAFGQFILGYALVMAASFIFVFAMQIAMITLILICIVPLLMIPYATYQMLIMNTVFAQAYATGREQLEIADQMNLAKVDPGA
jgi:hypothetical protein